MRISTRGKYGVRAMFDLAMRYGQGPIPLKTIAERQEISEHYLEQLMGNLRRAGLVNSVRGAQGGYELAFTPGEIKIGQIIRVLEGPIAPVECVEDGADPACERFDSCATRLLWERLRDSMTEVLDSTTLADLCEEAANL
ncbi:MAG: Rrf2 family transcriptional regulator [Firmicutes bacterium]|jgi:Rrf2 family cysteine metabolism transcriptional repressor|nr:Rrf2 family transcriptional regulator [Bacillota bacterium]